VRERGGDRREREAIGNRKGRPVITNHDKHQNKAITHQFEDTYGINSGEYALYLSISIVESSFKIIDTLYALPVLSNEPRPEMGMY
jgi:hypothetical protein